MDIIKPIFTREERVYQFIKGEIKHALVKNHLLELGDINKIEDKELWKKAMDDLLAICAKEAEPEIQKCIEAMDKLHKFIPQYKD